MRRALLLLTLALPLAAQSKPAAKPAPAIPADTAIHTGRLPNGLRYWVRHNAYPEKRLELRLVVRAGSVLEDNDQRGLAHFIEHMGFNGTTHFDRGELVKQLESMGVRFGADLNASTGFDETTYILPIPSDQPELVNRAFQILQDWAMGDKFEPDAVGHEHGVVMGEWRSGLGAGSRLTDKMIPVLFQGSKYALRLPIGDTTTILTATPALLRRYYKDWYRPNLMAVIAVGDYPVDSLIKLITRNFSGMKNPVPARARTDIPVPTLPGTRALIFTDPEVTDESVNLLIRKPTQTYRTEADERRNLVNALFGDIAAERMDELSRKPDAPFVAAGFGPTTLIRNLPSFGLDVGSKEGKSAQSFEATLLELRRLQVHGVLASELDRSKASLLRGRERSAMESEKTPSGSFLGGYINAFLYGYATPSAQYRYEMAKRIIPTITVAEVNAAIREAARGTDRFILMQGPEKMKTSLPTKESLIAILARTDTATVTPWKDATVTSEFVPKPPTPGRIVAESEIPALGVTEWKLSNGARVFIKPTDFKKDQLLLFGESAGGVSLLPDNQVINGGLATTLIDASGAGDFDALSLERKTAGKIVSVSAVIDATSQGVTIATSPTDMEVALQQMWLKLTSPRLDQSAVAALLNQIRSGLANRLADPGTVFSDSITAVMMRHSPRAKPPTAAMVDSINSASALTIYRDLFSDFGQYTFIIVGNADLKTLRPLVEQWLAALPAKGTSRSWRDVDSLPPTGVVNITVRKGQEPVANQVVFFSGVSQPFAEKDQVAANAAAQILETRLLDSLRQGMGATYSAEASSDIRRVPKLLYQSTISFQSSPAQADELWAAAQRIITAMQTTGPTADEVQKFVAQARRSAEVSVKTNNWWLSVLGEYLLPDGGRAGLPVGNAILWGQRLDALTPAMVQEAAKKYFDQKQVARFVLLPEK